VAIDPTTPLTPILPSVPAGTAPDSLVVAQAVARQALANATAELGQIVGRTATPQTPKTGAPVEQVGQTSTQDAGHAADASGGARSAPLAPQALTAKPTPETRMARAVRTAAAAAVPRQTGLAPLMANVRAVVDRPDMPTEVREAGRTLLAKAPQAAEITTPQGLRHAVQRSGVFLEARMARAAATPVMPETQAAPLPQANDMKAALLVFRGVLSSWLARATPEVSMAPAAEAEIPAEADEPTLGARPSPPATATQPQSPVAARSTVPAQPGPVQTPEQAPETPVATAAPAQPPQAEAVEETAPRPSTPSIPAPPPDDDPIAARFAAFVAPPKAPPNPIAAARAALSPLIQAGLLAEEAVAEEPLASPQAEAKSVVARGYGSPAADIARSKVPPPPYAGGPMAGQKPTPPALSGDQSPADIIRGLLKGTGGALARQDLMQIASLPEPQHHGEAEAAEARPQGARLNLDLPFVTPQGVAVAQFEISHDGGGSGGGAVGPAERTYKARFSIDIEPLGPVHALVTLTGARARVSLWAERAETIARLRAGEESLGAALRQAELSPEVAVHSGAPSAPGGVSPLGHFVDQAS
jgi:hypothetical protein